MSGGFTADPGAISGLARRFFREDEAVARLVTSLRGAGRARTGDGGLDGQIAGRVDELDASIGGLGMALESDGTGLSADASNYLNADATSVFNPGGP